MRSWFDISLEETGVPDNAYTIAAYNDSSIDQEPEGDIKIPEDLRLDKLIVNHYTDENLHPATGMTDLDKNLIPIRYGIGKMKIDPPVGDTEIKNKVKVPFKVA